MNTYTKEEIHKVLLDRLEREIRIQKERGVAELSPSMLYLQGYHEAICDSIWDLFDEVCKIESWDKHVENYKRANNIKIIKVPLKYIHTSITEDKHEEE